MATPGVGYVAAGNALRAAAASGLAVSELVGRPNVELLEVLPVGSEDSATALGRCDARRIERYERMLERLYAAGGQALLVTDPDYPAALRNTLQRSAPPVVNVVGNLELLDGSLAGMVGARDATPESLSYAADCARQVSELGMGVVSGAAKGIDDMAHATALGCGGSSVFVLPHGILRYQGKDHVREALEDGRAVLFSEFAPDAAWATHAAIVRNTTIAALSQLLCVFEPRKTGGSIRTAEAALAQSKPVLVHCLPGDWRVERRLGESGARRLPVEDPRAMRSIVEEARAEARNRPTKQQELF